MLESDRIIALLNRLSSEYLASRAAECQADEGFGLLDGAKLEKFPSFYDFLLTRGFSRFRLSAYGIGRDIEAW